MAVCSPDLSPLLYNDTASLIGRFAVNIHEKAMRSASANAIRSYGNRMTCILLLRHLILVHQTMYIRE